MSETCRLIHTTKKEGLWAKSGIYGATHNTKSAPIANLLA